MKHLRELRITFTDEEFQQLKALKKSTTLNWHDYMVLSADLISSYMVTNFGDFVINVGVIKSANMKESEKVKTE